VDELETKYPQGGEKQLIKAITGREVPPGKLPMDIGCVVFNVDTCASLYRAIVRGIPLIKRVVTVSGAAVVNPKNLLVRIGTPYYSLFEYCGGFYDDPYKIISGGPMMGTAQHSLETPVIKNTSALLAFSGGEEDFVENPTCIHCGRCVNVCPMRLMPNYIYMYAQKGEYEECKKLNVQDCIECGCCSYTCPGKLFLVQAMRMSKGKISR
jgi:electron transport complex protein RnfC